MQKNMHIILANNICRLGNTYKTNKYILFSSVYLTVTCFEFTEDSSAKQLNDTPSI